MSKSWGARAAPFVLAGGRACARPPARAPDIAGALTSAGAPGDSVLELWVEADPRDSTTAAGGRGTPKATVVVQPRTRLLRRAARGGWYRGAARTDLARGAWVRVWYDAAYPIQDSDPPRAVAGTVAVESP